MSTYVDDFEAEEEESENVVTGDEPRDPFSVTARRRSSTEGSSVGVAEEPAEGNHRANSQVANRRNSNDSKGSRERRPVSDEGINDDSARPAVPLQNRRLKSSRRVTTRRSVADVLAAEAVAAPIIWNDAMEPWIRERLILMETLRYRQICFEMLRHRAAALIQSIVRMRCQRRRFRKIREARRFAQAKLQRIGRGYIERSRLAFSTQFSPKTSGSHRNLNQQRKLQAQGFNMLMWWRRHKGAIPPSLLAKKDGFILIAALILQRFARSVAAKRKYETRQSRWIIVEKSCIEVQRIFRGWKIRKSFKAILREKRLLRQESQLAGFLSRCVHAPRLRRLERRDAEDLIERHLCQSLMSGLTLHEAKRKLREESVSTCGISQRLSALSAHASHPVGNSASDGVVYPQNLLPREWEHAAFCNNRQISTLGDESTDSEDLAIEEERMAPMRKPIFKPRREIVYNYFLSPPSVAEKLSYTQDDIKDATQFRRGTMIKSALDPQTLEQLKSARKRWRQRRHGTYRWDEQQPHEPQSFGAQLSSGGGRRVGSVPLRAHSTLSDSVSSIDIRMSQQKSKRRVFNRLAYGDMYH